MRIVGPNCQGMLSIQSRVWAAFGSVADETDFRPGSVSCAFQSGGFGYAVVNLAEAQGVGFRYCVSSGNETDIAMPELLSAFLDDPGTSLGFAYLEGTPDARRLLDVGRKSLETGKPVLIWKAGTTDAGIKAAASHTANMTGSYDLYRAALRQSGLIEVDDVEPIVDIAKLFGAGPAAQGQHRRRAVDLGRLGRRVRRRGRARRADAAAVLARDAGPPARDRSRRSARRRTRPTSPPPSSTTRRCSPARSTSCWSDPGLDQLVDPAGLDLGPARGALREMIAAAAAKTDKPVSVQWSGRQAKSEEAAKALEAASVPFIDHAGAARARRRDRWRALRPTAGACCRARRRRSPTPKGFELPAGAVTLNEAESKAVLRAFGVPVAKEVFVPAGGDADKARQGQLKAPFAVKVVSRDVPTRRRPAASSSACRARASPRPPGPSPTTRASTCPAPRSTACWSPRWRKGLETLIGVINDEAFGPMVALGLGGVLTEVLKDVTYRVAPFDLETAREMIAELRGARLFEGYRGKPAADKEALAQTLVAVSEMAAALAPRLKELDINPVFVGPSGEGVVAADALVVLE